MWGIARVAAQSCAAGTYLPSGATVCASCAPGSYTGAVNSATACTLCSAGHSQGASGATVCPQCPTGAYASVTGATACSLCYPGMTNTYAHDGCLHCTVGHYSSGMGQACSSCGVGTYAPATFATACLGCSPGSYANFTGASQCPLCAAGTYSGVAGATACTNCSSGPYAAVTGASACTAACPAGTYGPVAGNSPCPPCVPGTFCAADGSCPNYCTDCPTGTTADYGATTCTACPAGSTWWYDTDPLTHYWPIGACFANGGTCLAGSYSMSVNDGAHLFCAACPVGTFAAQNGASACAACNSGTYSALAATTCISCSPANNNNNSGTNGQATCQIAPCSPGSYIGPSGNLLMQLELFNISWSSASASANCQNPSVNGPSGYAWCPATSGTGDWLEYDFGALQYVVGITTYGSGSRWVTQYDLQYSLDGLLWTSVGTFAGNTDGTSAVLYAQQFVARYVRFNVDGVHNWGAMRASVTAYQNIACIPCPVGTFTPVGTVIRCPSCPIGSYSASPGASICTLAPGNATAVSNSTGLLFVSNTLLYYASSWAANTPSSLPAQLPAINSPSADGWVAGTSNIGQEYLVLDLGIPTNVWAIITQGRAGAAQWVTAYNVTFSLNMYDWTSAGSFSGNADQSTQVTQLTNLYAQYVKLIPLQYSGGAIAMRAGLMVAPPLVASIPNTGYTGAGSVVTCAMMTGSVALSLCQNTAACCSTIFSDS